MSKNDDNKIKRLDTDLNLDQYHDSGWFIYADGDEKIALYGLQVMYYKNGKTYMGNIREFDKRGYDVEKWLYNAVRINITPKGKYSEVRMAWIRCRECGKILVMPKDNIYCPDCKSTGHKHDLERMQNAPRSGVERLAAEITRQACKDYFTSRKDEVTMFFRIPCI